MGNLTLDLRERVATQDGRRIELSAREFQLLELFMLNVGIVLSREQLLSHVWGYDYDPGSNVVDVYVGYLRRKVGHGVDLDRARHGVPVQHQPRPEPRRRTHAGRRTGVRTCLCGGWTGA